MSERQQCVAVGCRRNSQGLVRIVLDEARRAALDVELCTLHRERVRDWAQSLARDTAAAPARAREADDWRQVDQGDDEG